MTLRLFTSDDFTGHWPVGVAAIVLAESEDDARAILGSKLKEHGLEFDGTLKEVAADHPAAVVLCDGNY